MNEILEITKTEIYRGFGRDYVSVAAESSGLQITFKVPIHRRKAYIIGREISVSVNLEKDNNHGN